jgi:hypothetical protein
MDALKGLLKSKTFWTSVIMAVAGVAVPPINAAIAVHPGTFAVIASTVMTILRTFTTQSLADKGADVPPTKPPAE